MNNEYCICDLNIEDKNKVFNNMFKFLIACVIYHSNLNKDFRRYFNKISENKNEFESFMYNEIFGGENILKIYSIRYNMNDIGICSLCKGDKEENVYINILYIHPEYRYRGYGKDIINKIIKDFPNKNVELDVFKDNKNAIKAYQTLGFKIINEYKNDIGDEYDIESLTMRLDHQSHQK